MQKHCTRSILPESQPRFAPRPCVTSHAAPHDDGGGAPRPRPKPPRLGEFVSKRALDKRVWPGPGSQLGSKVARRAALLAFAGIAPSVATLPVAVAAATTERTPLAVALAHHASGGCV